MRRRKLVLAEHPLLFAPARIIYEEVCPTGLVGAHPWGWGAVRVEAAGKGWPCPHCGQKARKHASRHVYLFGPPRCTACARKWCEANWPPRA